MERITILKRKWVDYMEKEKTTPVQEESCCCCHKKKERDEKEYKDLMNRRDSSRMGWVCSNVM